MQYSIKGTLRWEIDGLKELVKKGKRQRLARGREIRHCEGLDKIEEALVAIATVRQQQR